MPDNPTLADQIEAWLSAEQKVNAIFAILKHISPEILEGPEEALRAAIAAALAPLNLGNVAESMVALAKVVKEGKGVVGGGFDANLA